MKVLSRITTRIGAVAVAVAMTSFVLPLAASADSQFSDQSSSEALSTLRAEHSDLFNVDLTPELPVPANRITGFSSPNIAQVKLDGKYGYIQSTRALGVPDASGKVVPVDPTLELNDGFFSPAVSAYRLRVDADGSGGFTLGGLTGSAVRVIPQAPKSADAQARQLDKKLFFANVHEDTDTLLAPTSNGVETFEQIRSADAPTEFRYKLSLPDGAAASDQDGVVRVMRAGVPLLTVTAPSIVDADGNPVEGGLTVESDDTVVFRVDHHAEGVKYPVIADPEWTASYAWRSGGTPNDGFAGWYSYQRAGATPGYTMGYYRTGPNITNPVPGFWIYPNGGGVYQDGLGAPGVRGAVFYSAPGTTTIKSAEFRNVAYTLLRKNCGMGANLDSRQYLRFVLWDPNPPAPPPSPTPENDDQPDGLAKSQKQIGPGDSWGGQPFGPGPPENYAARGFEPPGAAGATVQLEDFFGATAKTASVSLWTVATSAAGGGVLLPPNPHPLPNTGGFCDGKRVIEPFVNVGDVDIQLVDHEPPSISLVGGLQDYADGGAFQTSPADWNRMWFSLDELADPVAGTLPGNVRYRDPGSGVRGASIRRSHPATVTGGNLAPEPPARPVDEICNDRHTGATENGVELPPGSFDPTTEQQQNGRSCPEVFNWSRLNLGAIADRLAADPSRIPPDGEHVFTSTVSDDSGQSASGPTFRAYFDNHEPEASATVREENPPGATFDRNRWIRAEFPTRTWQARLRGQDTGPTDIAGSPVAPGFEQSGVNAFTFFHDRPDWTGLPVIDMAPGASGCPNLGSGASTLHRPCPIAHTLTSDFAADLDEGKNTWHGHATDFSGNTGTEGDRSLYVDNTAPELELSGDVADMDGRWLPAEGNYDLDVSARDLSTATEASSGVLEFGVKVVDEGGGTVWRVGDHVVCSAPDLFSPPTSACPLSASAQFGVDASVLPEGHLDVVVDSEDAVGNRSSEDELPGRLGVRRDRRVTLHVDRTRPEVELTGQLERLADRETWVSPPESLSATVMATDNMSGIAALELWATGSDGVPRLMASQETCSAELSDATGNISPCPLVASRTLSFDPSRLPDGKVVFEARAKEFAGHTATERETVWFDGSAPAMPKNVRVVGSAFDERSVVWDRPFFDPFEAGIAGYEYAVFYTGQTSFQWTTTSIPFAPLGALPPGVTAEILVNSIDLAGNISKSAKLKLPPELLSDEFDPINGATGEPDLTDEEIRAQDIEADWDEGYAPSDDFDFGFEESAQAGKNIRVCTRASSSERNVAGNGINWSGKDGFILRRWPTRTFSDSSAMANQIEASQPHSNQEAERTIAASGAGKIMPENIARNTNDLSRGVDPNKLQKLEPKPGEKYKKYAYWIDWYDDDFAAADRSVFTNAMAQGTLAGGIRLRIASVKKFHAYSQVSGPVLPTATVQGPNGSYEQRFSGRWVYGYVRLGKRILYYWNNQAKRPADLTSRHLTVYGFVPIEALGIQRVGAGVGFYDYLTQPMFEQRGTRDRGGQLACDKTQQIFNMMYLQTPRNAETVKRSPSNRRKGWRLAPVRTEKVGDKDNVKKGMSAHDLARRKHVAHVGWDEAGEPSDLSAKVALNYPSYRNYSYSGMDAHRVQKQACFALSQTFVQVRQHASGRAIGHMWRDQNDKFCPRPAASANATGQHVFGAIYSKSLQNGGPSMGWIDRCSLEPLHGRRIQPRWRSIKAKYRKDRAC